MTYPARYPEIPCHAGWRRRYARAPAAVFALSGVALITVADSVLALRSKQQSAPAVDAAPKAASKSIDVSNRALLLSPKRTRPDRRPQRGYEGPRLTGVWGHRPLLVCRQASHVPGAAAFWAADGPKRKRGSPIAPVPVAPDDEDGADSQGHHTALVGSSICGVPLRACLARTGDQCVGVSKGRRRARVALLEHRKRGRADERHRGALPPMEISRRRSAIVGCGGCRRGSGRSRGRGGSGRGPNSGS